MTASRDQASWTVDNGVGPVGYGGVSVDVHVLTAYLKSLCDRRGEALGLAADSLSSTRWSPGAPRLDTGGDTFPDGLSAHDHILRVAVQEQGAPLSGVLSMGHGCMTRSSTRWRRA